MPEETSRIATALVHSNCLRFGSFRIKSGEMSPYYIDLAALLSSPTDFCVITDIAADRVQRLGASGRIDKLASIELKGALLLPSIGIRANLPCTIVRKEEKTYGAMGRITGASITAGEHVLFFDDVLSEGLSKLDGIRPLQELGARVESVLVVVDREQGGRKALEDAGYIVHSLSRISQLIEALLRSRDVSTEHANAVLDYIKED